MSEETHAKLSPSSAHRWLVCPGSVVLEADEPDSDNEFSKEGSLAHTLAAYCLEKKIRAESVVTLKFEGKQVPILREMQVNVQEYIDYVISLSTNHAILVEQKLEIDWVTGEKGAKGTSDSVILSKDGSHIRLIDLKYGMGVRVEAFDNPQLKMYALGALRQFDCLGEFEYVSLDIHQPRLNHIDSWDTNIRDLGAFASEVKEAVRQVDSAQKSNSLEGFLHPGEKQCKFCKAKHKCPALASIVAKETGADFDDISQTELITPIDAHVAMTKVELIEQWCKGLRAKVEADLFSGKQSKYWKLVEGKKGNRSWRDEDEVEQAMKAAKLTQEEMYNFSLLTPAKLEKKLKAKPKVRDKLLAFITQKQGQPSVAPISDPRTTYDPKPEADFEEVA